MKSAIAMSNCVRARGVLEWTPPSSVNCVSFAMRDFFEERGGPEPANVVVMLLMPVAALATLCDDLFWCCIIAAVLNWRIEL